MNLTRTSLTSNILYSLMLYTQDLIRGEIFVRSIIYRVLMLIIDFALSQPQVLERGLVVRTAERQFPTLLPSTGRRERNSVGDDGSHMEGRELRLALPIIM